MLWSSRTASLSKESHRNHHRSSTPARPTPSFRHSASHSSTKITSLTTSSITDKSPSSLKMPCESSDFTAERSTSTPVWSRWPSTPSARYSSMKKFRSLLLVLVRPHIGNFLSFPHRACLANHDTKPVIQAVLATFRIRFPPSYVHYSEKLHA